MSSASWPLSVGLLIVASGVALAADLPAEASPPPAPAPAAVAPPDWIVTVGRGGAAPPPDWIVPVGLEARVVPAWPGAADSRLAVTGLPLFSIRKAGTPPD